MKKLVVLLLVIFVFISCNDHKEFTKSDIQVIKNCISKITSNNPFVDSCYIVKPNFTFNSTHNAKEVLTRLLLDANLEANLFDNPKKWDSVSRTKNVDFSLCEKSEFVFSFSDIVENHILILLEYKYGQVENNEILTSESFENNAWDLHLLKIIGADSIVEVGEDYISIERR